jgi:hypothetical protein
MTFNEYIQHARVTDNPAGDFIADARRDPRLPPNITSKKQLQAHLVCCGACYDALATIPEVWQRYRAWLARRRGGRT